MGNQARQNYAHAFKVWLAEQKSGTLNPKPEPLVPAGLSTDEAKRIREQAAQEMGT